MDQGMKLDRIADEQRLEGDQVVTYVTASLRVDNKGPFFYRAKKTDNWVTDLQAWAEAEAMKIRQLLG
jgi:hypothetical protein